MEIWAKLQPAEDMAEIANKVRVPKGTSEVRFFVQCDGGEIKEVGSWSWDPEDMDELLD